MVSKQRFFELYNRNSPLNKDRDRDAWDTRLIYRKLSNPLAYELARLGVKANMVTIMTLLLMVVANGLFAVPMSATAWLLVLMYQLAHILDCVDGPLARYQGTISRYGQMLDGWVHVLSVGTFVVGFSIRVFWVTGNWVYLLVGSIGVVNYLLDMVWLGLTEEGGGDDQLDDGAMGMAKRWLSVLDDIPVLGASVGVIGLLKIGIAGVPMEAVLLMIMVGAGVMTKIGYRMWWLLTKTGRKSEQIWKGWNN